MMKQRSIVNCKSSIGISVLLLFFLPHCTQRGSTVREHISSTKNPPAIVQARLIDIPLPWDASPLVESDLNAEGDLFLEYFVPQLPHVIALDMLKEMENSGWRLFEHLTGPQELLIFEKPYAVSTISLRPSQEGTIFSIFKKFR